MTIEQLLCPAVMTWERDYRKKLNESHITMTDDEIADEFDKWLVENEDLINKSVEDNIEHINEVIKRGMEKSNAIYEKLYNDEDFDDESGDGGSSNTDDDVEDEPISGEVEGEEIDPDEPEQQLTLSGSVRLENNRKSKYDIFGFINDFYTEVEEYGTFEQTHKSVMRHLDVTDVKDMTALFAFTNLPNLNLESWNTGNVKKMEGMFYKSSFNNESICHWDVSSCADFKNMFLFCPFNQSLSAWTPAWVEKTVRNSDGTEEKRSVRADLPIIGGTEDEAKAMAKNFRRGLFKQFRSEDNEDIEENKNTNTNDNKMNHVVDFDTFVNEGKFRDFIDKGVEKIKNFFKSIPVKLGKLVAFFKEDGESLPVVSAYTSLNLAASGQIPGVTAFCDVQNEFLDGVESEANIVPSAEYYGIIKKDSLEYRNYETFKGMVNEHYAKYGDTAGLVDLSEDYKRVGLSAESGGVVVQDITSDRLKMLLNQVVERVPAYKGDKKAMGAVLIWGAPGVGKSSIPKAIINAWNEKKGDEFHKKALMVIECGDLTIDGFSLPIPVEKSIEQWLDERPVLKGQIEKSGIPTDTIERIKKSSFKISTEAPKTWLPAYNTNASPEEVKILNDIANGYLDITETDTGDVIKTETTEGGILLFDEFFRANEEVFKIMMQIILNRKYSGYKIGSKWGILCCSNRPNDDEEVRRGFEKTGPVVGNRFLGGQYNFIPSFDDWKKWAIKYGGFDNLTLEFLMKDKDPQGEYTNWHTIRPDEYTAKGRTMWPTPRSWSALMVNINNYIEENGLSSITEVPEDEIRFMADGLIGEDMSTKYASFLRTMSKQMKIIDVKSILENPEYVIPSDVKVGEVTRQVLNHIKTVYSPDELPDVSLLMNMFNTINKTYSAAKDNFTKVMHVEIIKYFKAGPKSPNAAALKEYVLAVDERYDLDPADLR